MPVVPHQAGADVALADQLVLGVADAVLLGQGHQVGHAEPVLVLAEHGVGVAADLLGVGLQDAHGDPCGPVVRLLRLAQLLLLGPALLALAGLCGLGDGALRRLGRLHWVLRWGRPTGQVHSWGTAPYLTESYIPERPKPSTRKG